MSSRTDSLLSQMLKNQCKILAALGTLSPSTTTPHTMFTASYSPSVLSNGQGILVDVTVPGLVVSKPTVINLTTDLTAFPLVIVDAFKAAPDTIRIWIEYQGGPDITLPTLIFQITQFNI